MLMLGMRSSSGAGFLLLSYLPTLKVKSTQPARPSESLTSTWILCVPGGTSATGMAIPSDVMNAVTRWVRSIGGIFLYVITTDSALILAPPKLSKRSRKFTGDRTSPPVGGGETIVIRGPREMPRPAVVSAGSAASLAVISVAAPAVPARSSSMPSAIPNRANAFRGKRNKYARVSAREPIGISIGPLDDTAEALG